MIPFPDISPDIFTITLAGREFALRWYAMAYLVGLLLGWWIIAALITAWQARRSKRPCSASSSNTRAACSSLKAARQGRSPRNASQASAALSSSPQPHR